jgi:hypothetical protein
MFFPTVNASADEQGMVDGEALLRSYEEELQRAFRTAILVHFVGADLQNY